MPSSRLLGLAATLAIFTACGETPTNPQPLDSDLLTAAPSGNPVVLSASGGGKITGPPGQDQFSFNALMRADGTVSGHVEFMSVHFGQKLSGNVVCMAWKQSVPNPFPGPFVPRDFLAIGTDIVAPSPLPPGPPLGPFFLLSIIDGGEGANAPADKMLPDFVPGFAYPGGPPQDAADSCTSFELPDFLLDIAVIDNGNIQVKP